ncbi:MULTISPECIES: class I SAM-dependent methyltransferase [Nocardiopsis]|uniref:class I SAM-dependent methyltransferase n=1 Tax=Nocardiopsis TaxID=2013 RepID=UPI0003460DDD|nr:MULTISPECIES: class I SAM-dependent methyltransferase [Nocardiopsis]PWV55105.1 methyltransferase family protein [Nocardiopsis sp. L17-MgMaSL7]
MPNTPTIDLDLITTLYTTHRDDLARVRDQQRQHYADADPAMTPQLDDLEAEITYLLLRHHRPANVVEIGTYYGWSTSWILSALRDNGTGHLHSFDIVDHATTHVPHTLADDRWTFTKGDVRAKITHIPSSTDYLFIDAAHNGWFARWYIHHLLPTLPAHIPVSVHDVFHQRYALPFTEGAVVLKWLANNTTNYFTASAARAPHHHQALTDLKTELGLDTPVRDSAHNPMIFFHLPERPRPGQAIPSPPRPRAHNDDPTHDPTHS